MSAAIRFMPSFLDFEEPIAELEGKIEELRHPWDGGAPEFAGEVTRLESVKYAVQYLCTVVLTGWNGVNETIVALKFLFFNRSQPLCNGTSEAAPRTDETCSKPPIFVRSPAAP